MLPDLKYQPMNSVFDIFSLRKYAILYFLPSCFMGIQAKEEDKKNKLQVTG